MRRFFLFSVVFFCLLFSIFVSAQSAYGPAIENEFYKISRSKVERTVVEGEIFRDVVRVDNLGSGEIRISVFPTEEISDVISFESDGAVVSAGNFSQLYFMIMGRDIGTRTGEIVLSGDISERIAVNISIVNESFGPGFFVSVETVKNRFTFKERLDFKIDVDKISSGDVRNVSFSFSIVNSESNESYFLGEEVKDIFGSLEIRKNVDFPPELAEGFYVLDVATMYRNETFVSQTEFVLKKPFWSISLFGFLPVWLLGLILGILILGIVLFVFVRRAIEKRKKYKMQLYTKTLPKKGERSLWLGKVAEAKTPAYLDMDALTTHAVVAGATGGGKSISAQVLIEEILLKNVAVIVFDPTAQWSGMLRKNEDKKMLSFYPKFGLKASDAKAFPGNLRQIKNERQAIDIKKYMNPGQIQVFALNKLTPPQIDVFVASVIANIFKSDPKEHPNLRLMLVFDEVHRLLPKFGGSGKGFLQIERACREFRKWGFGVMLVSQVLSDFVGEIKANINTEVQMRTRDEADLNRLKTKYGEEFLQSLIKASVGVGMFVNPKYNKGKPYFVNFRPILHNTRRLSDKTLEQYNKYSETIDDLEYQMEQLEAEKVDTFDLKMELKLVKDKLMTGNFTVVDIYLEGLAPRLEKQWASLGKKPKKREIELVDVSEIESSLAKAQKGREKFDKEKEGEKSGDSEDGGVEKSGEKEKVPTHPPEADSKEKSIEKEGNSGGEVGDDKKISEEKGEKVKGEKKDEKFEEVEKTGKREDVKNEAKKKVVKKEVEKKPEKVVTKKTMKKKVAKKVKK